MAARFTPAGRSRKHKEHSLWPTTCAPKKPVFDPPIKLGHVLTFVGFLITGFFAYSTVRRADREAASACGTPSIGALPRLTAGTRARRAR
jgi:hypothetical protein